MMISPRFLRRAVWLTGLMVAGAMQAAEPDVPEALKPWQGWALWGTEEAAAPASYVDGKTPIAFWPSRLTLAVEPTGGSFSLEVTVYAETWVPLPGSRDAWPQDVKVGNVAVPIMDRDGRPAVKMLPGTRKLEGVFRWPEIPQSLVVPREIGLLNLTLNGQTVELPAWDASGAVWLKRDSSEEETTKNFFSVKAYSVLEDGIPLWWRTQIELIVSGQSREEDIGSVLPQGWKLAEVKSPIPVVVDEDGRMRAQVRAGRWTIEISAFRLDNPESFSFAPEAKPAVAEELVAFQAAPDFRMVDIIGAPSVDVSQTTFPPQWAAFPVYRWDTATEFRIEERMRGMGQQKPEGLRISRQWWLDEDGKGLTFRDEIGGRMQQIWRLDAAQGQDLGSVRVAGQGQLITRSPQNGSPGVEIRTRDIQLEATGRVDGIKELSATGWRADADSLQVTLNLPPGWRLFALFGADWVRGDWLTAWSLLDLFLLLVFTFTVFRIWGVAPAILAFVAFTLSYHESGAPRYLWLALLVPLALLRMVPSGKAHRFLSVWKWGTIVALLLVLVPFLARQVQQALYPQMERVKNIGAASLRFAIESNNGPVANEGDAYPWLSSSVGRTKADVQKNMAYDTKARIQTGPGVPDWNWRTISFGWNGPVAETEHVRPILIPVWLEQGLSILRVGLLLALVAVLLGAWEWRRTLFGGVRRVTLLALCLWMVGGTSVHAQFPEPQMLDALRDRLLQKSDAFPNAATIPSVTLKLQVRKLMMEVEVHTATQCAVPLPGRLPAWSPVSVQVDGKPEASLRRDDGYLWVVLPAGVHRVKVEGVLVDATEWEWTFLLRPHRVIIEAPDWTFSGVKSDGVPEQQVFFALKQKATAGQASYDRQDFQSVAVVERDIELGLVWQVRTTVTRLSPEGKAVSLRIPLISGENVLTGNVVVKNGIMEVRLGAHEPSFSWESELSVTDLLKLTTKADETWVERWRLVASPVWNVGITGLAPIFEPSDPQLVPVWRPWPGESVELKISRPEAIAGETVTVNKAHHEISLGQRQRVSKLSLSLLCSLGEDFLVELPEAAEITSLKRDEQDMPVRKDGLKLIIPLKPGEQNVDIGWRENIPLGFESRVGALKLPVESANISTRLSVPESRWVLWTYGPLRGPAVQFWSVIVCAVLVAFLLGRLAFSPLGVGTWMLLVIGLTQVPVAAALIVIGWLFLLEWKGRESCQKLEPIVYNLGQVCIVGATAVSLGVFIAIVGEGLLGNPEMFIRGNGSRGMLLNWYEARSGDVLSQPGFFSVSIWWYRLLMLAWALWLAVSLVRWLRWGWQQFGKGGFMRRPAPGPVLTPLEKKD